MSVTLKGDLPNTSHRLGFKPRHKPDIMRQTINNQENRMKRLISLLALTSLFYLNPVIAAPVQVKMETSQGDIILELYTDKAPKTVANFLKYIENGFYSNTIFHRVIDGFMIQGGGFDTKYMRKPTEAPILNEADNGLPNKLGSIAMARTMDPHSATAQFFINVADNDFLNFRAETPDGWGYCVFGKVTDGMDVVDKIKGVETGNKGYHQDVPVEDVVIESVEVDE